MRVIDGEKIPLSCSISAVREIALNRHLMGEEGGGCSESVEASRSKIGYLLFYSRHLREVKKGGHHFSFFLFHTILWLSATQPHVRFPIVLAVRFRAVSNACRVSSFRVLEEGRQEERRSKP